MPDSITPSLDELLWLRLLAEASTEGIMVHEQGRILRVNAALARLLGYALDDLVGQLGVNLTVPADRPRLMAHIASGSDAPLRGTGLRRDGSTFPVELLGRTIRFDDREVRVVVLRDLTERERLDAARREADATLKGLLDQSLTGVYVIQDGRLVYVNERFAELFGYGSPAEVLALPLAAAELMHADDRPAAAETLRERLAGVAGSEQFRGIRRDGSVVHVEAYARRSEFDGRVAIVGTMLDVSERVATAAALAAREQRFRALVEHASDLIAILDADGTNRYASPSHEVALGFRPDEVEGRSCFEFIHEPEDATRLREVFAVATSRPGPTPATAVFFRHRDGSRRLLTVTLTDMRHDPAVGGIVANSRDVTAERALEEQLRQAQKMEAIGQLAGGVAHDFNNVLAVVAGYAQLLRVDTPPDDPRFGAVEEIARAAERGAGVTRQLLAFSRRQELRTEAVDLVAVARDIGGMLRALLPASITLVAPPVDAAPVWVRAARAPLEQVVLNLALNARDAMPEGGALTVAVAADSNWRDGARAVLTVTDTGAGMSPAVRERIFEPFFTTKPPGRGTGLGLSTVYGFVRQFGGSIDVTSTSGRGTTFTVAFPLTTAEAGGTSTAAATATREAPRPRRVLLVEDERAVRAVTARMLERAGYVVAPTEDGRAALALLDAEGASAFDLVLTDGAMPVMGGRELIVALRDRAPTLPVVLMSGYAELTGNETTGAARFVEKPFTSTALLEAVAAAIARRDAAQPGNA